MAWTDEQRAEAISAYEAAEPTEENSGEIVKEIAEDMDQSPNGVRMILSRAGIYINASKSPSKASKGTRVSKVDSQDALTAAIEAAGQEADDTIISKLTGKAAVYLTKIINNIVE